MQKFWLINGLGAQDQTLNTGSKVGFNDFFTTNTATHLNRHVAHGRHHVTNQIAIPRQASESPVQVDNMQTASTLITPMRCHGNRVTGKNRGVVHASLTQTHALALFQVNRWNQHHA